MSQNNIKNLTKYKRIGIFFLYDPKGIADNSVLYFLEQVKPHFAKLIVIVNGLLNDESRKNLIKIVDDVIVRENIGFDAWAYKTAIDSLGWKKIEQYDELTLFNFTNFGPLYPFSEMFNIMDNKKLDFWGITKHHGHSYWNVQIEEHIQSHWISIRRNMFSSEDFKEYWKNLPPINNYDDAVFKHEAIFTKKFERKNFKWDVYVNTDSIKEYSEYPLFDNPMKLIQDYRCPIIKKKCFAFDYVISTGENLSKAFKYIKNNLDYNTDFIWETILRLYNYADIKHNLHLNYILPSNLLLPPNIKNTNKIALIIHIYFLDLVEYCLTYAKSIPKTADVYIATNSQEKKDFILKYFSKLKCNKLEIRIIKNQDRDVGALLVGCKDIVQNYDLICFAHDKKTTQAKPLSIGESFSYRCWDNILKNEQYVQNIINIFADNSRLGLLFAPPVYHGPNISDKWGTNFEITKNLAKELGIDVTIERNKKAIAPFGTIFWFRPESLRTLINSNWSYEDFPKEPSNFDGALLHAIERLYTYAAQHEGYYSSWVMSNEFASMELENLSWLYYTNITIKSIIKLCAQYLRTNYPLILKIITPFYRGLRKIFHLIPRRKKQG